jgi:protein TonB
MSEAQSSVLPGFTGVPQQGSAWFRNTLAGTAQTNAAGYGAASERSASRYITIGLVALFHAGLVYALVSGLAEETMEIVRGPLETRLISDVKPPPKDVAPPQPKFVPPPPSYIPPPEVQIQASAPESTTTAITAVTTRKAPPPPVAPRQATVIGPSAVTGGLPCGDPDDIYPSLSIQLGESGTTVISALVDANGQIVDTRLDSSSGSRSLDQAALSNAAAICHFKAGTIDGTPAKLWVRIPFQFTIPGQ